jgi:predicted phage-related endonuclease
MALTAHQKKQRLTTIGASEVAAVLGVDPFRTAHDVYWSKNFEHHGMPPPPEKETTGITLGNALEDGLRKAAESVLGCRITKGRTRKIPGYPLSATPDGIIKQPDGSVLVVEIKFSAGYKLDFGKSGSEEVPDNYWLQCQAQMLVFGSPMAHLFALVGGDFRHFPIPAVHDAQQRIMEGVTAFYWNHLAALVPPPDNGGCTLPPLDQIRRVKTSPDKQIVASPELDLMIDVWRKWEDEISRIEKESEIAKRKIIDLAGDAEEIHCSLGRVTRKPVSRTTIDTKALKAARPEIAREFERTSVSEPALRFYPPKKGKE